MCYNNMMSPTYSLAIILFGFAIANLWPRRSFLFVVAE